VSFQTNILLAAKQISDKLRSMNATATIVQIASSDSSLYDELISDATLRKKTQKLFNDGHHARAVEEAYKLIDNAIKKKSGINDTGQKLMNTAFSVGNPVLRLNGGKNTSEKDEQQGYMQIFAGVMTGIRNPRAHESDWEDTERRALQLIVFANHLLERVSLANKNTVE
jgi:uncharacterized protein (TIGR02391 family)